MPISSTFAPSAPAARTGQGSAIANREDLSDALTLLAPAATPLLSLAPKLGKMESTFAEWPVDKLDAASVTGVAEGADVTAFADKFASVARLGNYCSILRRPWMVSKIQEAVKSAGPQKKARAITKAILELKRDIEKRIGSDEDRSVEDGGGTVYGFRGLGAWLAAATPTDVPAAYRTPTASIRTSAPTQASLDTQVASIFSVNGMSNRLDVVAGTALRSVISGFTRAEGSTTATAYHVTQPVESKKVTFFVEVFECAYGYLNIINANPDCVVNSNRGYLLNRDYYGVKDLLPLESFNLEDQGGGPRGYVEWAGTLVVKHPGAHGKIAY